MSKSVSDVDAIVAGLQRWQPWSGSEKMRPGPSGEYVLFSDAEAAVRAAYDCCEAEHAATMTSVIENASRHGAEAAVHATVREIETMLRDQHKRIVSEGYAPSSTSLNYAADLVARRFGGTDAP